MKLQQVIKQGYLTSTLTPVLIVETLLIVLYFMVTAFMSSQHIALLAQQAKTDLHYQLDKQTTIVNDRLKDVSRSLSLLQMDHQAYYRSSIDDLAALSYREPLQKNSDGTYYVKEINGNCSLYFSPVEKPSIEKLQRVSYSYRLDKMLARVVETNPLVNQAYLNEQYLNRLCPFIKNAPEVFGLNFDISQENFYYLADETHNPTRDNVWTSAYKDPAGMGWMVTVAAPIYVENKLMAVSGLDITISTLLDEVMAAKLSWQARAFIVDQTGRVLAAPKGLPQEIGLVPRQTDLQQDKNLGFTEMNILNGSDGELNRLFVRLMSELVALDEEVTVYGSDYLISGAPISETGWRIVYVTRVADIMAASNKLKANTRYIGVGMIAFLVIFYGLYYFYILLQSNRLAVKISDPVDNLSRVTTNMGNSYLLGKKMKFRESKIIEIDTLSRNFSDMLFKLGEQTQSLIEMQAEKIMLERISNIDALTGLYNRRKCHLLFDENLERLRRQDVPFGIIILDIDHFKSLNDTYGHNVGDEVLKKVAEILKSQVRKYDACGRWGGEEFILLCGQSRKCDVFVVAERVREAIETTDFEIDRQVTASFGVASCHKHDTLDDALLRADKVLYQAKETGRNKVLAYCD